jgi:hypothetical protein
MAFSVGIALGAGTMMWMPQAVTVQTITAEHAPRYDRQFAQLEQAVTDLTQALEQNNSPGVRLEPTNAVALSGDTMTPQMLTKILRQELQHALAEWSPEAQQARAQEIANAQLRDTPENKAAYQSASSVVRTALTAKRWTDEDAHTLRVTMGQLTREQHDELMELLLPAINSGEIKVETTGPVF